jgi:hypothetical protein
VYERLLEGWLDSASERSYQGPFCQVLSAQGYAVLHSTRHSPIEFGKDVIAVAPDGTPCAYQLKGNPGGRLTHAQFREISPQLIELATQAIVYPGCPTGPHRSYLVTNGNIDEEVQRAIDDVNRNFAQRGLGSHIEIIARGRLLDWFKQCADFWPTEIPDLHRMFKLLASVGNEQPPLGLLHELLSATLLLDPGTDEHKRGAAEIRRRITSAALILAVCVRAFSQRDNHYAVVAAWVLYVTYAVATCERHGHDPTKIAASSVAIGMETILRALVDLARETRSRGHSVVGEPLVDAIVYRGRQTLIVGLLSTLWLSCEREGEWPTADAKESIEEFIARSRSEMELWGQGALPQYLAYYWYWRATDATVAPDVFLTSLLEATTRITKEGENRETLLSPYYSFEDVRRHQLARIGALRDPLEDDSPRAASFFAEATFHLLVRTGLKQRCKEAWPDLTRIIHEGFDPDGPWGFCMWRSEGGTATTRLLTYEERWSNVVEDARCVGTPEVPAFLRERPSLLLLFAIVCPHRATPNLIRYLGHSFNESWFISAPVDGIPQKR